MPIWAHALAIPVARVGRIARADGAVAANGITVAALR